MKNKQKYYYGKIFQLKIYRPFPPINILGFYFYFMTLQKADMP